MTTTLERPPTTTAMAAARLSRARTVVCAAMLGLLLTSVAIGGYWQATGGRWYVVRTPSMGAAAPVGTLLWVKPVDFATLHVGDFISFKPPGSSVTYSHRIAAVAVDGTLRTKGDANSIPDAWRLTSADVVGQVEARWWGAGWLIRAAPVLILGGFLLWLTIVKLTPSRWHLPLAVVGVSVILSAAIFLFRPLVSAERTALTPTSNGVTATYVSTGLLPLRLHAVGGGSVDLRDGQSGSVSSGQAARGRFSVTLAPKIIWWWWLVLVFVCFAPAIGSAVRTARRAPLGRHRAAVA
jgi:signal peptidase I